MSDYIKRLFNMLIAAILAHANRLARLAAIRHEMEAYAAAYDEANLLEAAGKPELARFARAQIEETLGSARAADVAPQPAVNGDGEPHPFGLPRPTQAALGPQQGRESTTAPRRRGRRPSGASGAKTPPQEAPPQEASPQNPAGQADPTAPPTTTSDQHP